MCGCLAQQDLLPVQNLAEYMPKITQTTNLHPKNQNHIKQTNSVMMAEKKPTIL